jgi:AcrR family transcriptional regulator
VPCDTVRGSMTKKATPTTPGSRAHRTHNVGSPRSDDSELNRDKIVAAALKLLQRVGVEGLTMRALASELNFSPMATYRHVANRDEVLMQVADAVLSKVVLPPRDGTPWNERFQQVASAVWEQVADARWLVGYLVASRQSTSSLDRILTELRHILVDTGLSDDEAHMAMMMSWTFTLGLLSWADEPEPYLRYGIGMIVAGIQTKLDSDGDAS